jgi:hypothetical protein
VIVPAFIATLNVALTADVTVTPTAAFAGVVAVTVGASGGGVVVVFEPPPQPASIRDTTNNPGILIRKITPLRCIDRRG